MEDHRTEKGGRFSKGTKENRFNKKGLGVRKVGIAATLFLAAKDRLCFSGKQ